jgi:hypothetical protein
MFQVTSHDASPVSASTCCARSPKTLITARIREEIQQRQPSNREAHYTFKEAESFGCS